MNSTIIIGWHMIGDFDSKQLLNPAAASGVPLNPPFGILLSQAKPKQVAASIALACSISPRIVSLLPIQYRIRHHTRLQAGVGLSVISGMSSILRDAPFQIAGMSMYATVLLCF